MANVLEMLPEGARVVIIRLRSLGDCVLTTPAIQILKAARPDLHLTVVVEPRFSPVFEGNPDIDRILDPHARAAASLLRNSRTTEPRRLEDTASFSPDRGAAAGPCALCLNLHGGTRSMFLTAASRAPFRAGFAHFRAPWIYNVRIPTAQQVLGVDRKVHTAEHIASAVFYLGAPRAEIPRARLFAPPAPASRPYAVFHAFASAPGKAWPAGRFVDLARCLGLDAVFIGGPGDDFSPFAEFRTVPGAPLKEVMSLLRGAALFLGNDSGPAHMAAALGTPLVVLFAASDAEVWAPWKAHSQSLVAEGPITSISVSDALRAVERLGVAV